MCVCVCVPLVSPSGQESYNNKGGSYMQQNLQLEDGMDDVDVAIIADRNRDIQQLDRDMEELAEVYQVRRGNRREEKSKQ